MLLRGGRVLVVVLIAGRVVVVTLQLLAGVTVMKARSKVTPRELHHQHPSHRNSRQYLQHTAPHSPKPDL
jgi:hypothetical protein